jgi:hypothetical protein
LNATPVFVQVLKSKERLQSVGLDVGSGQDNGWILYDDFQVCVHEVHDKGDVGLVAEDVAKGDDIFVVKLCKVKTQLIKPMFYPIMIWIDQEYLLLWKHSLLPFGNPSNH